MTGGVVLNLTGHKDGLHSMPLSIGPFESVVFVPEAGKTISSIIEGTTTIWSSKTPGEVGAAVFLDGKNSNGLRLYAFSNSKEKFNTFFKDSSGTWAEVSSTEYFEKIKPEGKFKHFNKSATPATIDVANVTSTSSVSGLLEFHHDKSNLKLFGLNLGKIITKVVFKDTEVWTAAKDEYVFIVRFSVKDTGVVFVRLCCVDDQLEKFNKYFIITNGAVNETTEQEYNLRKFSPTAPPTHESVFVFDIVN